MSTQLINNTAPEIYGVGVINELQTLLATQSWQLNYNVETKRFSIIGCGLTVNKAEIEAIFARRRDRGYTASISDSFSNGHREFRLIPSSNLLEQRADHYLAPIFQYAGQLSWDEKPVKLNLFINAHDRALRIGINSLLEDNELIEVTWI